jgi:photosystem II stability/assembly factor-like uncharacterized protein
MSIVTSDGGEKWIEIPLKETPISMFFLNEGLGWMVTTKGLWRTEEAGHSWTKLPKIPDGILRVVFQSEKDGLAFGLKKQALMTHDGGEHWTPIEEAAKLPGDPKYGAFVWAIFADAKHGLITGGNVPPRMFVPSAPEWLDPAATLRMREVPHLTYGLSTTDGGATWRAANTSTFGQTARFRLSPNGKGIGLIEFSELFQVPSEVYTIDWGSGKSTRAYQDTKVSITDVWIDPDGTAFISGIEEPGRVRDIIPGKVKVLTTKDFKTWKEMPVDYRAEAIRTIFSSPDPKHRWIATDNGMILKLAEGK